LHELSLSHVDLKDSAGGSVTHSLEMVCQLTGLKQLGLWVPTEDDGLLAQLTQLKHLTSLVFARRVDGKDHQEVFDCVVSST
jgi:hypothetical protein